MPMHLESDRSEVRYDAPTLARRLRRSAIEGAARWRSGGDGSLVGDRIARFVDPQAGGRADVPFPGYAAPLQVRGPAIGATPLVPRFATPRGYFASRIALPPGTDLYGLGENAGPLRRNGRVVECWNWDRFGYDDTALSLYQSHPFVLGVRNDGSAFGVIAETTHRCEIDLTHGITFRALGRPFAVVVIERDHPAQVVEALAELTGRMELPPLWALGYQQCRWSYYPEARVREIAAEFRARRIPCDVLWLDIDYMDGYRVFTFDRERFPDPKRLTDDLRAQGFRTVFMIDPGIKKEDGYAVYDAARLGDHYVKDRDGRPYVGACWPGAVCFPDFTRARTRAWWADLYRPFMDAGVDGVWNDMNEPADFRPPPQTTQTIPSDAWHDADADLGGPDTHARHHNIYGMQMARATLEGIKAARPDRRPFVLTRSNFLGGHRYAATWTGDNTSDWRHLGWSIPMALNLGLSGQPFVGPDIGGFLGDATPDLFARWMGIGALLPFSRAHSIAGSAPHEPWAFGEDVEATCRRALERRMRLMPYLYTLFREASLTGLPVVRPAFFADPADLRLRSVDDAFLLGDDVYVRCSHSPATAAPSAPLPKGHWHAFEIVDTGPYGEPNLPRLHARPGAIVPLGPVMQHTGEKPLDPLTLLVNLDDDGRADGLLYEDDGDGHAHRDGAYRLTRYAAERRRRSREVVVRTAGREGDRPTADRPVIVELLLGDQRVARAEGRDGEEIVVGV